MKLMIFSSAFFVLAASPAAIAGVYTPETPIGSGFAVSMVGGACAVDDDGVKCWGARSDGEQMFPALKVPTLSHPIKVAVGSEHACALDDTGVHCWGAGSLEVPTLNRPFFLSANRWGSTCALDDDGVKCWGKNSAGLNAYRPALLPHPRFLSISGTDACTIDDGGAHCWRAFITKPDGSPYPGLTVPALHEPKTIAVGNRYACALDRDGVKCWGDNFYGTLNVPSLRHPFAITAGFSTACALDDDGIHCWGDHGDDPAPALRGPVAVAAEEGNFCSFDLDGAQCWGLPNSRHTTRDPVPRLHYALRGGQPLDLASHKNLLFTPSIEDARFNLDQIEVLNEFLSHVSSPVRAAYFSSWKEFLHARLGKAERSDTLNLARYLAAKLFLPAILSDDSSFFVRTVAPDVQKSIADIEKELGLQGISQVPATPLSREASLRAIAAIFIALEPFLTGNDRSALATLERSVGQALVDPMNDTALSAMLTAIDGAGALLTKANSIQKTIFVTPTVQMAVDWLKGRP